MSFRLWLEGNDLAVPSHGAAIFLDLDNTLVHSIDEQDIHSAGRLRKSLQRFPRISAEGETFVTCLRPGAMEFVRNLSVLGDVYILSMGSQVYVNAVQSSVGFPVKHAYSARELPHETLGKACGLFRDGEQMRPFVLVDNLDSDHGFTRKKLSVLGFPYWEQTPNEVFQLVPTWTMQGEESLHDKELMRCLPTVKAKLERQKQEKRLSV